MSDIMLCSFTHWATGFILIIVFKLVTDYHKPPELSATEQQYLIVLLMIILIIFFPVYYFKRFR